MTHEANRVLEQVLEDKLSQHRKASQWVHEEADLEATGEVLMGELVSGDLRTIERCLQWLRICDTPLPVTLTPGDRPLAWTLQIDQSGMSALGARDQGHVHAMYHLLFDGPEPDPACEVWAELSSIGLPPGLREDLDES